MSFIKTKNSRFVDGEGNEFEIKGIAFGNNIWDNPSLPLYNTHHTKDSYQNIAKLGFNAVRFYINYALFEDDDRPFIYKESGFRWLSDNIEWAKSAGVRLILNMHYPQGGYQSDGRGSALWNDKANQDRLCALWSEIAKRFSEEEFVIGYGLVNEPIAPENSVNPLQQWKDLAQRIAESIRQYDKNHILFIERLCGHIENGSIIWDAPNTDSFVLIDDNNYACEFHSYEPFEFSHQGFEWCGTENIHKKYPVIQRDFEWAALGQSDKYDIKKGGWQCINTEPSYISDINKDGIQAVFQAGFIGDGAAYIDELYVHRINDKGEYIECVFAQDFRKEPFFYYYSPDGTGKAEYKASVGYRTPGCIMLTGARADSNIALGLMNEALHSDAYYVASVMICCENVPENAVVRPRLDSYRCVNSNTLAKDWLKSIFEMYINFGKENNVAMYCGEFGAGIHAFEEDHGGEQYIADLLSIFLETGIAFSYHTYHEVNFGLYRNDAHNLPDKINQPLADVFAQTLL